MTGVQTCALPIFKRVRGTEHRDEQIALLVKGQSRRCVWTRFSRGNARQVDFAEWATTLGRDLSPVGRVLEDAIAKDVGHKDLAFRRDQHAVGNKRHATLVRRRELGDVAAARTKNIRSGQRRDQQVTGVVECQTARKVEQLGAVANRVNEVRRAIKDIHRRATVIGHVQVTIRINRQAGRLRPANVLDCDTEADSIEKTVARSLSDEFRSGLADLKNPFGDGRSGRRIVQLIEQFVPFDERLSNVPFQDGPAVQEALQQWTETTTT